jgi:hypothetical protein
MWGRKKADKSSSVPAKSTADASVAPSHQQQSSTPASSVSAGSRRSSNEAAAEPLHLRCTQLENELREKSEEVDDLSSNLSIAKESLRYSITAFFSTPLRRIS